MQCYLNERISQKMFEFSSFIQYSVSKLTNAQIAQSNNWITNFTKKYTSKPLLIIVC